MNFKRLAISVLVIFILSFLWGALTCGWLFNWVYQIPPTEIWLRPEQMSMTLWIVWGLVFSFSFVFVYAIFYEGIPSKGLKKGLYYGLLIWFVGALPGIGSMSGYMVISHKVIIYWILNSLVQMSWQGLLVGWIYNVGSANNRSVDQRLV